MLGFMSPARLSKHFMIGGTTFCHVPTLPPDYEHISLIYREHTLDELMLVIFCEFISWCNKPQDSLTSTSLLWNLPVDLPELIVPWKKLQGAVEERMKRGCLEFQKNYISLHLLAQVCTTSHG